MNRTPAGGPVVLLTTTGRRTGQARTVVLGCFDDGDCLYVAASNGGNPREPGWIHNLRANPTAEVQYGAKRFTTQVEILDGDEREEQWTRYTQAYPDYADARRWARREIPTHSDQHDCPAGPTGTAHPPRRLFSRRIRLETLGAALTLKGRGWTLAGADQFPGTHKPERCRWSSR